MSTESAIREQIEENNVFSRDSIDLREMGLSEIPEIVNTQKILRQILVDENPIKELPEWLRSRRELESISAVSCQLEKLPEWLGLLSNLNSIHFNYNLIEEIPISLSSLKLNFLDIAFNRISEVPTWLSSIQTLNGLTLDDNPAGAIPEGIGNLRELGILHIENMRLTSLPESILDCRKLAVLSVGRNPALGIPDELTRDEYAVKKILRYYFEKVRGIKVSARSSLPPAAKSEPVVRNLKKGKKEAKRGSKPRREVAEFSGKLERLGWWIDAPELTRKSFEKRAIRWRDEPYLCLAPFSYDAENREDVGPCGDPMNPTSYADLFLAYGITGRDTLQISGIKESEDEEGVSQIVFDVGARRYSADIPPESDWFDVDAVHGLLNKALEESGSNLRWHVLPVLDQIVYPVLVSPAMLAKAMKVGLVPTQEELQEDSA